MRTSATFLVLLLSTLASCSDKKESAAVPPPAAPAAHTEAPPPPPPPPPAPAPAPPPASDEDASNEIAALVVHDVGSKALGNQKIEASCVSVLLMPAGKWTVASARLEDCGDKTARSILWLYKRGNGGKWNEDYVGQPPKCWKGVPPDLIEAVIKATKIPSC